MSGHHAKERPVVDAAFLLSLEGGREGRAGWGTGGEVRLHQGRKCTDHLSSALENQVPCKAIKENIAGTCAGPYPVVKEIG